MEKYLITYFNAESEVISAKTLLEAQKAAHKKAAAKKTMVLNVKLNNL